MAYNPFEYRQLGQLIGANMNSTADQAISIDAKKYIVDNVIVTNPSTSMAASVAAGGFYSAASKGGTVIVANTQLYTPLSAATKFTGLTLALTTDSLAVATIYLSLTTAHGSTCTADVYIFGWILQ